MGRVPTRGDVSLSAKRLDPKALDLFPLHVSSDEMDPEDFRKIFGLRQFQDSELIYLPTFLWLSGSGFPLFDKEGLGEILPPVAQSNPRESPLAKGAVDFFRLIHLRKSISEN